MVLSCSLIPAFIMPSIDYSGYNVRTIRYTVIALLWYYYSTSAGSQFAVLNPSYMLPMLPFTAPMLIFAVAVVRYCQTKISLFRLIGAAFLSIALPLFMMIIGTFVFLSMGIVAYTGPVPIHLVIGAVVIKYSRIIPVSPWDDEEEIPWWEKKENLMTV